MINPRLRRENRIRTIHSSLAIEHNTLTIDQVTAIIDGKRVLGNPNEIQEVKNAYEAYELILKLDPNSVEDLLSAHKLMMKGLVPENGRFRSKGVGIFDGEQLIHMAPPADLVPKLIADLFEWHKTSEVHPLIKVLFFITNLSSFILLLTVTDVWEECGTACCWDNGKSFSIGFQSKS